MATWPPLLRPYSAVWLPVSTLNSETESGLVRSGERLSRAIRELRHMQNEIETFYRVTKLSDGLIGLRNAIEVALLVALAARHNRQSRGCHYRTNEAKSGDRLL